MLSTAAVALAVAGCIPIGIKGQSRLVQVPTEAPVLATSATRHPPGTR